MRRLAPVAVLGLLAALPAAAQAPGRTEPADCFTVLNTTGRTYPVEIKIEGHKAEMVNVEAGQRQLCLRMRLPKGETALLTVRSFLAPVGSCRLAPGARMEIYRAKADDGREVTRVGCPAASAPK